MYVSCIHQLYLSKAGEKREHLERFKVVPSWPSQLDKPAFKNLKGTAHSSLICVQSLFQSWDFGGTECTTDKFLGSQLSLKGQHHSKWTGDWNHNFVCLGRKLRNYQLQSWAISYQDSKEHALPLDERNWPCVAHWISEWLDHNCSLCSILSLLGQKHLLKWPHSCLITACRRSGEQVTSLFS